ncbi:leucyl aminopeptidase family protein [Ancylobacter dichloromethanicus]|uniref:Leucyl aminopeptidase n=1 Tax=Ancylobacter dichloromethanicus TaxID=518825 RepID=A0A9W6JAR8_9HYPH|nr:leucyl aminopeptidase family protein [Ancylobacter dichloromethanicus]MBS7552100.1 leucyl aminopeptidase family protein [Ancylobacter dichloromethanicus]GLK73832.1 leucyl aminopeptidase [Ancylobacter dichloromethanicus]
MGVQLIRADEALTPRPIWCVTPQNWREVAGGLPAPALAFGEATGFKAEAGALLVLPAADGAIAGVLFGCEGSPRDPLTFGRLATTLPAGDYAIAHPPADPRLAALGFLLGGYRFTRYGKRPVADVRLVVPDGTDEAYLRRTAEAVALTRDLVNTPANDLGPAEIEAAVRALASRFGAQVEVTSGDDLLAANFPLIHAVGRASPRAPRLIDLSWGDPGAPKVTLVGKGVAFDTGGLDIKPSSGMLLMKKDMGGAANAIGLAQMIMARALKVRLRLIVPAVENSIDGSAFRPGDVFASRKGLTVEIGNTDAEGRLILADALSLADEEAPELLIDFATLTGAARVALGPQLPPAYTGDDTLAADLARHGAAEADPSWRMPLWPPYASMLDSRIADLNNAPSGGFAGSITAALFLQRFVTRAGAWLHLDIFAWNPTTRPGRPEGGEAQTIRALDALIAERYGA